jgi:hypothetical protein
MAHWTDKRHARAELGNALRRAGWKLFGWHEDKSDSRTDYYDPESWNGIGTKDGAVVVVNETSRDSGRVPTKHVKVDDGPCATCGGTGLDPSGWTLTAARQEPARYHQETDAPGTRSLLPGVVSPIPFVDGGRLRCRGLRCSEGRIVHYAQVECPDDRWPTFQGNPKGRVWHVERNGKILASGSGVFSLLTQANNAQSAADRTEQGSERASYDERQAAQERGREAYRGVFDALARKIDAAAFDVAAEVVVPRGELHPALVEGAAFTVRNGARAGFVEVVFPSRPSAETLAELKAAGYRWARLNACWYGREVSLPERYREVVAS